MRRLTISTLVLAMFALAFAVGATYDSSHSTGAKLAPAAAGVKWGGDGSTSVNRTYAGVKWGGDSTSVKRTQAKVELGDNQSQRA